MVNKTIREIMTKEVTSLLFEDTLRFADDMMAMAGFRHFPVFQQGKVVGVASQLDLVRASLNSLIRHGSRSPREVLGSISVGSVKMERPWVISPDTSVKEAAQLMVEKKIDCLLVLEGDTLVGLVTRTDLLREMAKT